MKICVVFTGGTIASRTNGTVVELGNAPYALLEGVDIEGVDFVTAEPYSILSEELTAERLCALSDCIKKNITDCEAVIVTHGTDSLVYTAAFLSYVFADTRVPIYLVSSGYPLDDSRANGRENFSAAVNCAVKKTHAGGVYIAWAWTAAGETRFCPGVRSVRQRPYDDLVEWVAGDEDYAPPYPVPAFAAEPKGFGSVYYIKELPSVSYPPLGRETAAVIIESYHSGTLCAGERFAAFMKTADELGIPVFITGTGGRDADYETVGKYKALGAVPLAKASPDAMYVKLCLVTAFRGDKESIVKLMTAPSAGDMAE